MSEYIKIHEGMTGPKYQPLGLLDRFPLFAIWGGSIVSFYVLINVFYVISQILPAVSNCAMRFLS